MATENEVLSKKDAKELSGIFKGLTKSLRLIQVDITNIEGALKQAGTAINIAKDNAKDTIKKVGQNAASSLGTIIADAILNGKQIPKLEGSENIPNPPEIPLDKIKAFLQEQFKEATEKGRNALKELFEKTLPETAGKGFDSLKNRMNKAFDGMKQGLNEFEAFGVDLLKEFSRGFFDVAKEFLTTNVLQPLTGVLKEGAFGIFEGITGFLGKNIGGVVDGIGGFLGNIFSGFFGGGKARGGPVSSDKFFLVGERGPEIFIPSTSGQILPNSQLSAFAGAGAVGSNFNVNIFNNSGSQVETQQSRNSSGGIDIDVMIDQVVGKNIRRGGQTFSAIRDTFGTSVRTVGR